MPLAFCGKALKQSVALMLATFVADAGMRLIDNHKGGARPSKIVPATVGLDLVQADDRTGIGFEEAL